MRQSVFCLLASCAATAFTAHAQAQEAAAPSAPGPATSASTNDQIQEIVVTAQRRAQVLNDVGMSINVQSGEQLRVQGVNSSSDLSKVVAALNIVPANTGFNGTPIYTLRGVGFNERSLSALSSIAIYQDEVPLSYPYMTAGPILDVQRVEVLKGPQGTLYGQNSTGGAINYISNRPTDDLTAGAQASYGRFNQFDLEGFVSGPITDTLKARLAIKRSSADGWQTSITRPGDRLGSVDQWAGRLLIEWSPSDRFKVNVNLNGWRDRSESPASQIIALNPSVIPLFSSPFYPYQAAVVGGLDQSEHIRATDWTPGTDYRNRNSFKQASVRLDWDLTDALTLTSVSAWSQVKVDTQRDVDSLAEQIYSNHLAGKIETLTQEIRLSARLGADVNVIAGVNYSDDTIHSDALDRNSGTSLGLALGSAFGIPQEIWNGRTFARSDRKSKAVFANLDYDITPRLAFTGGVRYTKVELDYQGCTADSGNGAFAAFFGSLVAPFGVTPVGAGQCVTVRLDQNGIPTGQGLISRGIDEDNVSWRAGLNYKPSPDMLLYANISRGYKSGDIPTVVALFDTQLAPVVQEKLTAYEVGFKATIARRLQINAAVFHYDYRNKQLYSNVLQPPPISFLAEQTINIPKSRINGAELELNWRPVRGLTLRTGVGYTDSKILKAPLVQAAISTTTFPLPSGFVTTMPIDVEGDAINLAPKWQTNADAQYDFNIGGNREAFIGGTMTYASSTSPTLGAVGPRIDAHTIFDARLGIRDDAAGWRAWIWGRNIFNENYATSIIRNQDVTQRYVGMPATFGITVGYDFR